jgi:hypothetical protein
MFVMVCVARALLAASSAGLGASSKLSFRSRSVVLGLPGQYAPRCAADVGTVEVQADALTELGDLFLGQTRIGTRAAGLGAFDACLYAFSKDLTINMSLPGVGLEHLLGVGHGLYSFVDGLTSFGLPG